MADTIKRHRADRSRQSIVEEMRAKGLLGRPVDKRVTVMRSATTKDDAGGESTGTLSAAPMTPTDAQLEIINTFTRTPKTADDVVVFDTMSCNDLVDRDDDKFTTDTVKAFAALQPPFGPVGKSYMVSHNYSNLPVGRIFDTDTTKVSLADTVTGEPTSATFLRQSVYMPNTEQYKSFIENLDFGVYWAVSVGVMLDGIECGLSWCGKTMHSFWGMAWCEDGHWKSDWYDQKNTEVDSWGDPMPVAPGTKGAEKCIGLMVGARDFYELSQCFLGAQFYAELADKNPTLSGVIKAASAKSIPIIGLGKEEADALPLQHLPEQVRRAFTSGRAQREDDGSVRWVDGGLLRTYDPEGGQVLTLGKAIEDDEEVKDGEEGDSAEGRSSEPLGADDQERDLEPDGGEVDGAGDDEGGRADEAVEGEVGHLTDDPSQEGAGSGMSKQAVLAAVRQAKLPTAVAEAVLAAKDNGLSAAFSTVASTITDLTTQVGDLTPKAALGTEYLVQLRAEAVAWYVKAHQEGRNGVNTSTFEKMLDRVGDDVELITEMLEEQKTIARARFPRTAATVRSSAADDPNTAVIPALADEKEVETDQSSRKVRRLHT